MYETFRLAEYNYLTFILTIQNASECIALSTLHQYCVEWRNTTNPIKIRRNATPGVIVKNEHLINSDQIMPDNYTYNDCLVECRAIQRILEALEPKYDVCIASCIYSGARKPSVFVITNAQEVQDCVTPIPALEHIDQLESPVDQPDMWNRLYRYEVAHEKKPELLDPLDYAEQFLAYPRCSERVFYLNRHCQVRASLLVCMLIYSGVFAENLADLSVIYMNYNPFNSPVTGN